MNVCVDACFLLALYDPSDSGHGTATELFQHLFADSPHRMVVPWPILYETVSTRMARRRASMEQFHRDWKSLQGQKRLLLLFDRKMRQRALGEAFRELDREEGAYRALSLVDRVVRNMLLHPKLRLHAFITFNPRDFLDVCEPRRIQVLQQVPEA